MAEDILLQIRQAEDTARLIVEEAEKEKAAIIRDAEIEAGRLKEKELAAFREKVEARVREAEQQAAAEAAQVIARAQAESQKLRKVEQGKRDEALALLKKEWTTLLRGNAHVLSGKNG